LIAKPAAAAVAFAR